MTRVNFETAEETVSIKYVIRQLENKDSKTFTNSGYDSDEASEMEKGTGRPKVSEKCGTVGIRVLNPKQNQGYKQLLRAFGKVVSMPLPVDVSYDDLMTHITAKLFPDGINPIVGNIDQYSITIVNAGNIDVKQGIEHNNFTIWLYQKEHMVGSSGILRLHLYLTNKDDPENDDIQDFVIIFLGF